MNKLEDIRKQYEATLIGDGTVPLPPWNQIEAMLNKHYMPVSEATLIGTKIGEEPVTVCWRDDKGNKLIPISEVKILIAKEMIIASSEGHPTSRLTSLYNKLPINKTNKEDKMTQTELEEKIGEILTKHFMVEGTEPELLLKIYPRMVGEIAKDFNQIIETERKEAVEEFAAWLNKVSDTVGNLELKHYINKYLPQTKEKQNEI